jgi:hypothetical protein
VADLAVALGGRKKATVRIKGRVNHETCHEVAIWRVLACPLELECNRLIGRGPIVDGQRGDMTSEGRRARRDRDGRLWNWFLQARGGLEQDLGLPISPCAHLVSRHQWTQ